VERAAGGVLPGRGGVESFSPTPMLLAMRHFPEGTQGQSYWYHLDGRGSIAGITQHQGQSTHNYRYDAYGQVLRPGSAGPGQLDGSS
jgi:YD repeat-containing protein